MLIRAFLTLVFITTWIDVSQAALVNRNVLDLDKKIYTQRDVLVWSFAHEGLFYKGAQRLAYQILIIGKSVLYAFRDEMIINHHIDTDSDRILFVYS